MPQTGTLTPKFYRPESVHDWIWNRYFGYFIMTAILCCIREYRLQGIGAKNRPRRGVVQSMRSVRVLWYTVNVQERWRIETLSYAKAGEQHLMAEVCKCATILCLR
jgi:hypothetical protein